MAAGLGVGTSEEGENEEVVEERDATTVVVVDVDL